ncbi:MAG: hypothetical protein O3B85_12425 [Planctomycetota bacterium]|nr:hypothetical protein [Planctomycetota bacterium]
MNSQRRSKLVFGAVLAFVVSLSGVRGVAAESEAVATDLVLEPLAAPQGGLQFPGFSGGRFGGGGDPFGGSLFGDLGSFFGGLRFGSSSGGGDSSGEGGAGGGGITVTARPGSASEIFLGRYR